MMETLSPALAWVVASLTVPQQFAQVMQQSVQAVNAACKREITTIDK